MEIKSKTGETVNVNVLTLNISTRDRDTLIDVLLSITKRAKADRFEEYIINELLFALKNPIKEKQADIIVEVATKTEPTIAIKAKPINNSPEIINKAEIIAQLKNTLDPRNEKAMDTWIAETVTFGRQNFGIKTVPEVETPEGLYDWLLLNNVITADGRPNPLFGK